MKKILIVITTSFVPYGGLTTVMMNYYRAMDKEGLQIDFASTNIPSSELLTELEQNGSKYYNLENRKKSVIKYIEKLSKLLKEQRYDIIHVNGNSSTMLLELLIAKCCGVKRRIAHGHNTRTSYPMLNQVLKFIFKRTLTTAIAVSSQTGDWLYGEDNYVVLKNAIDLSKYRYNGVVRKRIRNELDFNNKFVVGTVGKLNYQKNHEFLLKVFKGIYEKNCNAHLLIVGGGELEKELEERCNIMGISCAVTMTGMKLNAAEYLQAMDVFVFPSRFEGLGLSLIEAQASGLHCIASDSVPKETALSECVEYLGLDEDVNIWIDKIMNSTFSDREVISEQACRSITDSGYNIAYEAMNLKKIYLKNK